jgi:hypothetical protein
MSTEQMQAAADRLASKLDALDLDDDERAVLGAIVRAGASSAESAEDDVEGFALNAYLGFQGQKQGQIVGSVPHHEKIHITLGGVDAVYLTRNFGFP